MCFTWSLLYVGAQKKLANIITAYNIVLLKCLKSIIVKIYKKVGSYITVFSKFLQMSGWIL